MISEELIEAARNEGLDLDDPADWPAICLLAQNLRQQPIPEPRSSL